MSLQIGANLGPYQILALLGAGGMGEVYRARDTRLNRVVAIKVLPSHLSFNLDLKQRLEREARAVSSLNHPHICALYDIGKENGTDFLVMEYIEGETLATRLRSGPLAQNEMLRYAIQIADALEKAHKQGIVHRDLKPGNIILAKSGAKLLDFGLAKIESESKPAPDVSSLATENRELTKEGTVLGTFQYMAPEQLEGREVDARTDIFAFGAVLYEMATGKKAFEGKSQASLIAAILKDQPRPISQFQPLTPPILDRLIQTCLAKDPDDRWQSAHDISNQLRWIAESSNSQFSAASLEIPKTRSRKNFIYWATLGALAIALSAVSVLLFRQTSHVQPAIETRFAIVPARGSSVISGNRADADFAVSPDGTKIVYPVADSSTDRLYVRAFASNESQLIAGTEGARFPFWSPDGQQIAFITQNAGPKLGSGFIPQGPFTLKRILLSGGTAESICNFTGEFRGAVWLPDGTIVFGMADYALQRVSVEGGSPTVFSELNKADNETGHSFPFFLPDYQHYLYLSDHREPADRWICLASIGSKKVTRLIKSPVSAKYLNPGFLLFIQSGTLMAQRFESDRASLIGEPIRIADHIAPNNIRGTAPYSASTNGVIAYRSAGTNYQTQLAWVDRGGKVLEKIGQVESAINVSLSPDRKSAVIGTTSEIGQGVGRAEIPLNLWSIDLMRGVRTRITFDPSESDENPVWSRDKRWFFYAAHIKGGQAQVFKKSSSGEGQAQPVLQGSANEHPIDISPDGKFLMMQTIGNAASMDLVVLPLSGDQKMFAFVDTPSDDGQAQFSPDGRFVAYTSQESGQMEVYVKPFPSGEGKWQISTSGGAEPRWRSDGKELFYVAGDGSMMSVKVNSISGFDISSPEKLFQANLPSVDMNSYGGAAQYDVAADGTRFLMETLAVPETPPTLNVITNWRPPTGQQK